MTVLEITRKLTEAYGPSGHEGQIRSVIREEIESMVDDLRVDALGNLIAIIEGDKSGKRVLLAAHMDEIGVIVTHIDEKGFPRIAPVGGVRPGPCIGHRVRFVNGTIGVIGVEKREKIDATPTFDQLYLDVGAKSKEEIPVGVGDMGCFDRSFVAQQERWTAKAMDDRIGCAILVQLIREINDRKPEIAHTVQVVFSVQEEVGLRGATTAAFGLEPDIGIAIDVTLSGDTPKPFPISVELGKGPAIKVKDSGMISHPGLVSAMIECAESNEIPYQLEVLTGGTTDARAIQISQSGVISGCVSVPCRYVHTSSETVDSRDVENSVELILACLQSPLEIE
ncbi:MAG: M42 family metallopeptidase [Chloroflexota bacterium]